jgi:hypothetical protein
MTNEVAEFRPVSGERIFLPLVTSSAASPTDHRRTDEVLQPQMLSGPGIAMSTDRTFTTVESEQTESPDPVGVNPTTIVMTAMMENGRATTSSSQAPHDEALYNDLTPQINDDPDTVVTHEPNGINTIPATNTNMTNDENHLMTNDSINHLDEHNAITSKCLISANHQKWFTSVHNCWMGHRGVTATLDLLKQRRYIWDSMQSDVQELIAICPTCQKLSVKKLDYNTHPFTTSTYQPHERINIDSLDLNQPDKHGNTAIIVVIDTFTRWIVLYTSRIILKSTQLRRYLNILGDTERLVRS